MKTTSRDKLLAALAGVDFRGIYMTDAAKKAGLSITTVRKLLASDDGTIRVMASKYVMGGGFYGLSASDKLTLVKAA